MAKTRSFVLPLRRVKTDRDVDCSASSSVPASPSASAASSMTLRTQAESLDRDVAEKLREISRARRASRRRRGGEGSGGSSDGSAVSDGVSVSFRSVRILDYPIIVGDNPSCSSSPPLQMDWSPRGESTLALDDFEALRSGSRHRLRSEMILPPNVRIRMLHRVGYYADDILSMTERVERAVRAREKAKRREEKIKRVMSEGRMARAVLLRMGCVFVR
mmetsp:Transcript_21198/g.42788  ORF Transcript_21198/g.42788 Transcript_21198/m.42788 type:complete len:218 (-) Transcript_21198:121-774(-)